MAEVDWRFVEEHCGDDPVKLRLKYLGKRGSDAAMAASIEEAITQIDCRRRYARKFPGLWERFARFRFPSKLAGEQASHLWAARFHAAIARNLLAEKIEVPRSALSSQSSQIPQSSLLFDMTAGLGIDFIEVASAITSKGRGAIAVEMDEHKADVLRENLIESGLPEAEVLTGDSMHILRELPDDSIFLLYADPARRGEGDSRIYNPNDCLPDVVGYRSVLLDKAEWLMIKNSPMLDLHRVLELFPDTAWLYVLSVRGECKEVLVVAKRGGSFKGIRAVNILKENESGELLTHEIEIPSAEWSAPHDVKILEAAPQPGCYLYEPDASVMKASPWATLTRLYPDLKKCSPNCHVFLSPTLYPDFPGRVLIIDKIVGRDEWKSLKGEKLNVVTRNYPKPAEQLAKSLKVKSGGIDFIYGVTLGSSETPALLRAQQLALRP